MAADETTSTKVEESKTNSEAAAVTEGSDASDESLLSLESLDGILSEEDPEFAKSLQEIGPDEAAAEIYNEGLELEYTLPEEVKYWEKTIGDKKWILKVFPFLPRITFKYKMFRTSLRLQRAKFKERAVFHIKNFGPWVLKSLKNQVLGLKTAVGDTLSTIKNFSLLKKILLVGLVTATGLAGFVIYRIATKGIVPSSEGLFISSLEEWSQGKYSYDVKTQTEKFYDSMRASQSILVLSKMVVNLRRSATSGPNPMGAFEFYVEGAASEVVVEIKDREPEMKDLIQRTIEDMTFDQVSSGEGKQLLSERLRKEINKVLTKGKVRRVFIKTAIVKP